MAKVLLLLATVTILQSPAATLSKAYTLSLSTSNTIAKNNNKLMISSGEGSIICAGLSCLDLQLVGCTQSGTDEAIERYDEAVHCAGGSASMTGTTLALLLSSRSADDDTESINKQQVHIVTKIGPDFAGNTLLEFYRRAGASTKLVLTDDTARTSMAVLPIFNNGKRGCFVNLACNDGFTPDELLGQLDIHIAAAAAEDDEETISKAIKPTRALLFGYPHLMPRMQGESLRSMLHSARQKLSYSADNNGKKHTNAILIGVDLNGVDGSDPVAACEAILPSLCEIDVLHLNEDEAMVLSSLSSSSSDGNDDSTNKSNSNDNDDDTTTTNDVSSQMLSQISTFHEKGCAVVLLSLGSKGAFVSVTPNLERLQQLSSSTSSSSSDDEYYCPSPTISQWTPGTQVHIPAFKIEHGEVNTNGAGDALFSGFCLAACSWGCSCSSMVKQSNNISNNNNNNNNNNKEDEWKVSPYVAGTFASLVAWQRCNAKTRDGNGMKSARQLMELIYEGSLPNII